MRKNALKYVFELGFQHIILYVLIEYVYYMKFLSEVYYIRVIILVVSSLLGKKDWSK